MKSKLTNEQIIEHLAIGMSYKQVATMAGLAERTIINRVLAMRRQQGCSTVIQLVVKMILNKNKSSQPVQYY